MEALTWSVPTWWIILTLVLGSGAGLLTFLAMYWDQRKRLRKFAHWQLNVEHAALQAIRDDARAVESKLALMQLVQQIPEDFQPTAFLTCRIGEGLQRAIMFEAEQQGVVPEGTFERVFQQPLLRNPVSELPPPVTTPLDPKEPVPDAEEPSTDSRRPPPANVHELGSWLDAERKAPSLKLVVEED